jgi:hypothetical protein
MAVCANVPITLARDGVFRFKMLDQLLRRGSFEANKYSLYGPLAAAPLWYLGEAIGFTPQSVWMFNRIVFLATLIGLWCTLGRSIPAAERIRFVLLLLFGSMFPWHLMFFFSEVLFVAGVGFGLTLVVLRPGWPARLGVGLAVWATANAPATTIGLALAAIVLCWQRRKLRYLLLPVAAGSLIVLENWLRRGHPLEGGYGGDAGAHTVMPYSGQPGFSYPLFFGLLAVLFSFGKGLIFFTPGLFAPYPEADSEGVPAAEANQARSIYQLWLAVVIGLVLVYAQWWAWYGGTVWGPRFFLFACLPAALVLARWSARPSQHSPAANLLVLLALTLSCWVGADGLVYQDYSSERLYENDFAQEHLEWFVPEFSVLWRPFVTPRPLSWYERGELLLFAAAYVYLARPLLRVLTRQLAQTLARVWRVARTGPRWQF